MDRPRIVKLEPDLRKMGYAHGRKLRDEEIKVCRSIAFRENLGCPPGCEMFNYVHCLNLNLQEKRLSCIDARNLCDVVYATESSNIVQLWTIDRTTRPETNEFGIHKWNSITKNSDFLRIKNLVHPTPVKILSYMEDRILFTGSDDGSVRMYDSIYELMDTWFENITNMTDIHYNLHFDQFAVTGETSIRRPINEDLYGASIFSFYRKGPVHQFFKHENPTETLRFDKTAMMLAIVDTEGVTQVFDTRAAEPIRSFVCGSSEEKKRVEFSPDSKFIAAKHMGKIKVFEVGTGREYSELPASVLANNDFEFSYNSFGNRIAMGGSDGLLRLWDVTIRRSAPTSGDFCLDGPVRKVRCTSNSIFFCVV